MANGNATIIVGSAGLAPLSAVKSCFINLDRAEQGICRFFLRAKWCLYNLTTTGNRSRLPSAFSGVSAAGGRK